MSNRFKILIAGVLGLMALAMTDGGMKYIQKIVGVYSQQNFMVNGDFEKNKYGVTLQGTVGSATTSLVDDPAIYGNALEITSPSDGLEILLPIDQGIETLSGLNCEGKVHANLFSANTEPMILDVDVVRGTSTSISNVQRVVLNGSGIYPGSGWKPISVNFPCGAVTSASYIRVKVIDAGVVLSGNIVFELDSVYAGEATNIINQVVVTDWQDFPSVAAGTFITGTTTNPTYGGVQTNRAQYRYVGSDMEMRWDYRHTTAGTAGTGNYLINIPSSVCVIDTMKAKASTDFSTITAGTDSAVGKIESSDANNNLTGYVMVYSSSQLKATGLYVGPSEQGRGWFGDSMARFSLTPLSINVTVKVPCVGRSATQSAITQQCIQDGSCENTFSAHVTSAGVVSNENIDWIQGNCTGGSPTTCTFKTNFFSVTPSCQVHTAFSGGYSTELFNTLSASQITVQFIGNNAGGLTITCHRTGTDYKPRFSAPVLVGSVTSNSQSALRIESVSVTSDCTSSPCTIARQSSAWVSSIARTGTGQYSINLVSGTFSSAPDCYCSSISVGITATNCAKNQLESTSLVRFVTVNLAGASNDSSFSVTCVGPRQ